MTTLQRNIGLVALTLYGVGDILGAGIYGLIGKAAGEMGNTIWLAFLASMVAAGLTGLSYASIGSRHPKAAGAAYVTHLAFRKTFLSYATGLVAFASGLTSMATASRVFAGYLTGAFPGFPFEAVVILFGCALAFVIFWGIRESMWVNTLCTVIEVSGLLFILFVGIKFIGTVDLTDATTVNNPTGLITPSLILSGAVLAFYSFIGFEDILNVSEEVKDPSRNVPLGLLLAIGISSIIYIGISLVAVSVVPSGELAKSTQPLVDVAVRAAPWFPPKVFSFIAMFAVANTALLNFLMGSRLLYGMSKQGLLPKPLSKVHAKRKTPYVATLIILGILLLLALSGDIAVLARATSALLLMCFVVVNASLIVLKRRPSEPKGKFEIPIAIPIAGVLVCLTMLSFTKSEELMRAGIILAVIGVLYFVVKPKNYAPID